MLELTLMSAEERADASAEAGSLGVSTVGAATGASSAAAGVVSLDASSLVGAAVSSPDGLASSLLPVPS